MGGIDGRHLLDGFWRMALAGLFMALVTWIVLEQLSVAGALGQLVLGIFVGAASYLLAVLILQVTEFRQLVSGIQSRLGF